jgi:hypothetical protein
MRFMIIVKATAETEAGAKPEDKEPAPRLSVSGTLGCSSRRKHG